MSALYVIYMAIFFEFLPVNVWLQYNLKFSASNISIPEELWSGEILDVIAWTLLNSELVQKVQPISLQSTIYPWNVPAKTKYSLLDNFSSCCVKSFW